MNTFNADGLIAIVAVVMTAGMLFGIIVGIVGIVRWLKKWFKGRDKNEKTKC